MKNNVMKSRSMAPLLLLLAVGLAGEASAQLERFAGTLENSNGSPLVGQVTINSLSTTSQSNGAFELYVPRTEPYIIGASAIGHVPHSEVYVGPGRGSLRLRLTPAETATFNPAQPLDLVDTRGTRLQLPARALVDANGNAPSGPLTVSMHSYDVRTEPLLGDMTGLDSTGQRGALRSFGAVSVEFSDAAGNLYNLAPGRRATLSARLPAGITFKGTMPLWWFDTQQGLWREEGSALIEDGVATGQVSHFTVWSVGMKFTNPACIQLRVDPAWFTGRGYNSRNPLRVQAEVTAPSPKIVLLEITGVDEHVLYNLEPGSTVRFSIAGAPYDIVNAGGAWGGASGYPAYPYTDCQGSLLFDGTQRLATIQGQVRLQHSPGHQWVTVQLATGNTVLFAAPDASGNFSQQVPAGTYAVTASMPGHLSAERANVSAQAGTATALPPVTLAAGDVDASRCVDAADMGLINTAILSDVSALDPRDMDGDGKVGFNDLRLAAGNGRRCGPISW